MRENLAESVLNKDWFKRTMVGLPIALVITAIFLYSNTLSQLVIAGCYLGCLSEWIRITLRSLLSADKRLVWLVAGGAYITLATLSLFDEVIKNSCQVLTLIAVICVTDIGAYFIGRWLKGPKLAPRISPNKTWSGSLGGFVCASIVAITLSKYFPEQTLLLKPFHNPSHNICYLVILIFISQIGDLLESYVKRYFNIKDSGSIMPGHGGFLDRLDSILAVGLFILLIRSINHLL